MMTLYLLTGMVLGLWLVASASSVVALCWGARANPRRFRAALVASGIALLLGYVGATRIHVAYSVTSNNVHWGVDSRWFFILPLVLGLLALVLTLVNRRRFKTQADDNNSGAASAPPPAASAIPPVTRGIIEVR